jgi:Rrf2 family protein
MQLGKGTEYALHSLFYMIDMPIGTTIGIKELAELNKLSETYLSKIFTKLRKSGIVRSSQGAKGGYELAKRAENISFWDIIEAVEGSAYMFQCAEIRQANILADETDACKCSKPCLIKVVMQEAEDQMRMYLAGKTLAWLRDAVYKDFSDNKKEAIEKWVAKSIR